MLGRGSRLHEDKQDCLVIDFQTNFERLFDDMMTGQDDLDESVNSKKKVVKKSAGKNAKEEVGADKYGLWQLILLINVLLTPYYFLQKMTLLLLIITRTCNI